MSDLNFFDPPALLSLAALSAECQAEIPEGVDPSLSFRPVWPLGRAGPSDVAFFFDDAELDDLMASRAGACFVRLQDSSKLPATTIALVTSHPLDAFRRLTVSTQTGAAAPIPNRSPGAVHADARLEQGVSIGPGVVVGPSVEIGTGTAISANSVIGAGVRIGRGCQIDSHVSIRNALIGDRVIIQAGARIGMATPELAPGPRPRIPRLGRVIIQDDADIGPNAVVDRGTVRDTMIGDGVRIAALTFIEGGQTIDRYQAVGGAAFSIRREMG